MKKLAYAHRNSGGHCVLVVTAQQRLAADGKAVYADNCAKCHGDDGKGQTKMGQKLGARGIIPMPKSRMPSPMRRPSKSIKEGMKKKDDMTLMKPSESVG